MKRFAPMLLVLLLSSLASGYVLDTEHPLYSYAKGIYVFDGSAGAGDNIAGTGTMVGTVEDADGFDTPITQTFQSWYNSFGSAYTICVWHGGWTLGTWNPVFILNSAEDPSALRWSRQSSETYCSFAHSNTSYNITSLAVSELANPMMLSIAWSPNQSYVYDGTTQIATQGATQAPKTNCTTATLTMGGTTTVTRVYVFSKLLNTDELGALQTDPNSIFTEEEPPLEPPAKVTTPDPADEQRDVPVDQVLNWAASEGAMNYNVYFGLAGGPLELMGNVTEQWYDPVLNYSHVYDWRVDPNNASGATEGDVWTFYTEAEPVVEPNEPDPEPEPMEVWRRSPSWDRQPSWIKRETGLEGWRKR
jgi:hypothetical protein